MSEANRIADEIRRSVYGDAWHGPSLMELLDGVTPKIAGRHPIRDAHSIHEIVLHLITWMSLSDAALRGNPIPEWPFPEDWPPTEGVEWSATVERLKRCTDELADAVSQFEDAALTRIVPGRDFDFYFLLHGISQHNGYHGGQIALLKK